MGSNSIDMAVMKPTNPPAVSRLREDMAVAVKMTRDTALAASTWTRGTLTACTRIVRIVAWRSCSLTAWKRSDSHCRAPNTLTSRMPCSADCTRPVRPAVKPSMVAFEPRSLPPALRMAQATTGAISTISRVSCQDIHSR